MFHETPIYSRLVAERGDIPAMVRGEADRIHHHLAQVMHLPAPPNTHGPGLAHAVPHAPGRGRPATAP
ncbi:MULTISPECIES: hypothetical protein [unclassified Streptomyces]|uniref:hypothetical protein n=1 Tax=unclassified Streptomyces TaxID=2593676 RepID=UPI0004C53E02|nr:MULTISPECIES: hypothetical protein [unclassified Streptomyces]KOV94597.1 hypothetical protein ADL02_09755 [Streptomyces sp. NRRL WC-3723]